VKEIHLMEKAKAIKVGASAVALLVAGVVIAMQFTGPAPGEVIIDGQAEVKPAATAGESKAGQPSGKSTAPRVKREGGGRLAPGGG
jgi:hypothetical protein